MLRTDSVLSVARDDNADPKTVDAVPLCKARTHPKSMNKAIANDSAAGVQYNHHTPRGCQKRHVQADSVLDIAPDTNADPETVEHAVDALPTHPESMTKAIANDSGASVDYNHYLPKGFQQPHVQAAFQAQYTEMRLHFLMTTLSLLGVVTLITGAQRAIWQGETDIIPDRPMWWLGTGVVLIALFIPTFLYRQRLLEAHFEVRVAVILASLLLGFLGISGNVMDISHDKWHPELVFAAAYGSGLYEAISLFVFAHLGLPLWLYVVPVAHGVTINMSIQASAPSCCFGILCCVLECMLIRHILLQHSCVFTAKV